ncbi:RING-H2 finger protein ATL66 [Quercus suber]|uniref:E3 ubiquitin-protein ligase ring1 n=1 Tax=Quercus suber TaxID=58331 RepID=A0AAW0KE99_QUESU
MAITDQVVNIKYRKGKSIALEASGTLQVYYHTRYQKGHRDLDGALHLDVDIRTFSEHLFSLQVPTRLLSLPAYHHAYLLQEVSNTLAMHLDVDPQINYFVALHIASQATDLLTKAHPFGYSIAAEIELVDIEKLGTDNDDEDGEDFGTCSVCLEDFSSTVGSKMVVTDCSHFYHESCILPWLMRQNTCPTCRSRIFE